jgi:site-specific DNA-methyltransferase (adenine-specific)
MSNEPKNMQQINQLYFGDNLGILKTLPSESVQLIYIDPPFNTGRTQSRGSTTTTRTSQGNRVGFKGQRYEIVRETVLSYDDEFEAIAQRNRNSVPAP